MIDAFRINPRLRRIIRDELPEVIPHFATPEIDAAVRERVEAYLHAHRAALRPPNLAMAMNIVFTSVEAVCDAMAEDDRDAVLDELASMLQRYLLADG
jgi:hypothetical protein